MIAEEVEADEEAPVLGNNVQVGAERWSWAR
jgi:hypothetical protein